jgi:hypothetical protein
MTYSQWLTTLQQDNNIMGGEPTFFKPHDLKFSAIFFNLNVTMKGQT